MNIPNHLLDEIIDLIHENVDTEYEREPGDPNSNYAILTGDYNDPYGHYQISTGIDRTPELYENIRLVLQQAQHKTDLHFHIPEALCSTENCDGYALVYPSYNDEGKYSNQCRVTLSCKHEVDDSTLKIALQHYVQKNIRCKRT